MFLESTTLDHSLLYFIKIFGHLPVIAAACYFSVYKLIGWDKVNLYLFKVTSKNTRKRCGIYPKFTRNTVEICSAVLFVNFKDISKFFSFSVVDFKQVNVFLV